MDTPHLPRNTIVIYVTAPEGTSTLSYYGWNDTGTLTSTHIFIWIPLRLLPSHVPSLDEWPMNGLSQLVVEDNDTRTYASTPSAWCDSGMIKRRYLEGHPPLGEYDGYQTSNPSGNCGCLAKISLGYICEQTQQVWTEWNHTYGGIPIGSSKVFGQRFQTLSRLKPPEIDSKQTSHHQTRSFRSHLLSEEGRNCAYEHSPDGSKMVYSCFTLERGSSVYIAAFRWFRRA